MPRRESGSQSHWLPLFLVFSHYSNVYGEANNARVSALFNCRTTYLDERADDHTELVHVLRRTHDRESEERHASWLAEQIGQAVIGPRQE